MSGATVPRMLDQRTRDKAERRTQKVSQCLISEVQKVCIGGSPCNVQLRRFLNVRPGDKFSTPLFTTPFNALSFSPAAEDLVSMPPRGSPTEAEVNGRRESARDVGNRLGVGE